MIDPKLRKFVADRLQHAYNESVEDSRRLQNACQALGDSLSYLPDWLLPKNDGFSVYFTTPATIMVDMPWNMGLLQSMRADLEQLGWKLKDVTHRGPTEKADVYTFVLEAVSFEWWWGYSSNPTFKIYVQAMPDDRKPDLQRCHLVQIGEKEEVKKIPIYDVICDDSYREMTDG